MIDAESRSSRWRVHPLVFTPRCFSLGVVTVMSALGLNLRAESLDEFRGKISQQNVEDTFGFERAQYMQLLMSQQ